MLCAIVAGHSCFAEVYYDSGRVVGKPSLSPLRKSCPSSDHNLMAAFTRQCPGGEQLRRYSCVTVCRGVCLTRSEETQP